MTVRKASIINKTKSHQTNLTAFLLDLFHLIPQVLLHRQ